MDRAPARRLRRPDSLRTATASRAVPLVAGYGLNLVATPLVVSGLGLAQFGLWALTGSFAMYGSLLDLGVSRSVTRFTALHVARRDDRAADQVVWTAVVLVLCVGAPLLLLAALLAGPFGDLVGFARPGEVRIVLIASVVILVTGQLCTVLNGSAFGREVQSLPNAVTTVCGVTSTCATTATAVLTHDVVSYAIVTAAMNTLTLVAITVVIHTRVERLRATRPSWRVLRELAAFGLKGQSVLLAELVIFQLGKILLGVTNGTQASGAYELGSRLALGFRTLGSLFTGALTAPLTRYFSASGEAGVSQEAERLTTKVVTLSIAPPLAGFVLAPAFLGLWLGDYNGLSLTVMALLCLAFAVNLVTGIQTVAAEAIGRPGLSARSAVVTALLSLALGVPLLFITGPTGLVVGTAVSIGLGAVYAVHLVQPALGSTATRFYRAVTGPVAVGAIACVASKLATAWMDTQGRLDAGIAVAVGGVIFTAIYVPLALRLGYLPSGMTRILRGRRNSL